MPGGWGRKKLKEENTGYFGMENSGQYNKASAYALPGIPKESIDYVLNVINADTPEAVLSLAAANWGVTTQAIKSKSRKGDNIILAKHTAAFVIRNKFKMSAQRTGQFVNKDYSTVLHSCKVFKNEWETNKLFRKQVVGLLLQTI